MMIDLKAYLKKKICAVISAWNENDIYAISFFIYSNESWEYHNYSNVTEFFISYNTESDCAGAGEYSEERWNYAFWRQNVTPIITANADDEGMALLFKWYQEKGINNIGYEDYNNCYDEKNRYIGKGPVGYYELLTEITAVAKCLQESGFIREVFGKQLPIIIHDLDYSWYVIKATKEANPDGEASVFLASLLNWYYQ